MSTTASAMSRPRPSAGRPATLARLPLLALGVLSLLAALWGGLLLLGLPVPTLRASTASGHGPLMTLGFLGTVISLERAVALRRLWAFCAPASAGLGGVVLLVGGPASLGWALLCAGSVVFVLVYAVLWTISPMPHIAAMAAGAVCWYVATVLWFGGWSIPQLVPWLAGFLVLTILGERLELARVALLTRSSKVGFVLAGALLGVGLVLTAVSPHAFAAGARVAGAGLIALSLWGIRYDVARHTVRLTGVTRFMAVCLLAGYAWLLAAGIVWVVAGDLSRSVAGYDAALHAVFLGFVMSMIFGHAPVIVPAVLDVRLPFRPWFYGHVALLHAALLLRVLGGDAAGSHLAWQIGGAANEAAVLLFIAVSAIAVLRGRRPSRPTIGKPA